MHSKLLILGLFLHSIFASTVYAQFTMKQIENLQNDKEVVIRSIKKKEREELAAKYTDVEEVKKLRGAFYQAALEYVNYEDSKCDFHFVDILKKSYAKAGFPSDRDFLIESFKVLRIKHAIDDILVKMLEGITQDKFALEALNVKKKHRGISFKHKELIKQNDLAQTFSGFNPWPDEVNRCAYREFLFVKTNIKNKEGKNSKRDHHLKVLIERALKEKVITLETFNKLEYLRKESKFADRNLWLTDYFKVILLAKNKMRPKKATYEVKILDKEDDFSSERIRRFSKITRRGLLYRKYNETQIVLLSQVLQKASRRMGVDPDTESKRPVILQEFSILNDEGGRDNYVDRIELDPQSQFNLARRLLRKDMVELQMMDAFVGVKITHEDIVMASFETGYITFEDLEHVVKYDDLWNPHKTEFEKIIGFVSTVAGISTIFLPPPWNITASIALGVVEGLVLNTRKNGAENDNPATFIE